MSVQLIFPEKLIPRRPGKEYIQRIVKMTKRNDFFRKVFLENYDQCSPYLVSGQCVAEQSSPPFEGKRKWPKG
jgi:hypothetical protein